MTTTIAVLGASQDRKKFGNKAVRAFRDKGFRVFPIHPSETAIEGIAAFRSLDAIAERIDIVTVYLPPPVGLKSLPAIAAKKPRELWLNPGAESPELIAEARRAGLDVRPACSLIAYGLSPSDY